MIKKLYPIKKFCTFTVTYNLQNKMFKQNEE